MNRHRGLTVPAQGPVQFPAPATGLLGRRASVRTKVASQIGGRTLQFLVGALIVLVISRFHQNYPFLAKLRPAMVLAGLAVLYGLANPKSIRTQGVTRSWWFRLIFLIVAQAMLSVPFGISMGNSGKFILYAYSTVVVLALFAILATRSTLDLQLFVNAYLIGAGGLAWLSIFVFKLQHGPGLSRLANLPAYDANDVGLVLVTALPLAVTLLVSARGRARWLIIVLLAGLGIAIARTGSRGGFLALLVVGLAILLLVRGVSLLRKGLAAGVVAGGLVLAAPPGYFDQMKTMLYPKQDYNWTEPTGRREVTKRGIGYMLAYPAFGVGIDNFSKAECTISPRLNTEGPAKGIRCTAPHNTWIEVGAELGVPGLLLWLLMLSIPLVKLLGLSRRLPEEWLKGDPEQRFLFASANGLPLAILGYAVASSFLSFAWFDVPYLLVIFSGSTWWLARRRLELDRQSGPVRGDPGWRTRAQGVASVAGR